jgi:hypothetical protein
VVAAGMSIRQTGAGSQAGSDNTGSTPPPVNVEVKYAIRYSGGDYGEYTWVSGGVYYVDYGGVFQWTETISSTPYPETKIDKYQFNELEEVTVGDYSFNFTSDPLYTTTNVMLIYRSYYYTREIS